jgi:hypothetical protein
MCQGVIRFWPLHGRLVVACLAVCIISCCRASDTVLQSIPVRVALHCESLREGTFVDNSVSPSLDVDARIYRGEEDAVGCCMRIDFHPRVSSLRSPLFQRETRLGTEKAHQRIAVRFCQVIQELCNRPGRQGVQRFPFLMIFDIVIHDPKLSQRASR